MGIFNLHLSYRFLKVVKRHILVWLKTWTSALAWAIGEPIIFILAFGIGLKKFIPEIQGQDYASFIAPGLIATGAMNVACYECTFGSYSRLEMIKAYDAISSTPIMPEEIALADAVWGGIKSVITSVVMIIVFAFFGVIHSTLIFASLPGIFFMTLIFSSLSLIITSVAKSYDFFSYFFTVVITPAFFLSGAFFPVDNLPDILRTVAKIFPVTFAVDLTRNCASGILNGSVWWKTVILAIISIPALTTAIYMMKRRIVK